MRIGINALYMIPGGVGGTEIYLRNLLRGFAAVDRTHEYVVFTNAETGGDLVPDAPNFTWSPRAVRAASRPARILDEQSGLAAAIRRAGVNVLLNPGYTGPVFCPCPAVTVFHDMQHKVHPEYFRWFDLPFWRLLLWLAAKRSAGLISVSEATRQDLLRFYHADSHVIHHGVEPALFELAARRDPQDFLLCVSTLHPHKNLERLLRVHGRMFDAPELVVTGLRGFAAEALEKVRGPRARFTGWIPREELLDLFRRARAFVYPSTFEGFGMPVLEAMAAGVPVACADIPPLREIAAGMAVFFDPSSDDAMQSAIERVLIDPSLAPRAAEHALTFTWEKTARETIDYLSRFSS